METTCTPGPWEPVSHLVRTVRGSDGNGGYLVAECPVYNKHRANDARLIAAAPELLAALIEARDALFSVAPVTDGLEHQINAAIAKAEGK